MKYPTKKLVRILTLLLAVGLLLALSACAPRPPKEVATTSQAASQTKKEEPNAPEKPDSPTVLPPDDNKVAIVVPDSTNELSEDPWNSKWTYSDDGKLVYLDSRSNTELFVSAVIYKDEWPYALFSSTDYTLFTWNDDGTIAKTIYWEDDGDNPHAYEDVDTYTYDDAGNLVLHVTESSNIWSEDVMRTERRYTYENDQLIKLEYWKQEKAQDKLTLYRTIEYTYNDAGQLINSVEVTTSFSAVHNTTTVYTYDNNGRISYVEQTSDGGQGEHKTLYIENFYSSTKKSPPQSGEDFLVTRRRPFAFSPSAKRIVSLGQALASNTPQACCL